VQDGEITEKNVTVSVVGKDMKFTILEDDLLLPYITGGHCTWFFLFVQWNTRFFSCCLSDETQDVFVFVRGGHALQPREPAAHVVLLLMFVGICAHILAP
jgi:hypothetical protein